MILDIVLSIIAPLLTAIAALVWAGFVAPGMGEVPTPPVGSGRDLKTW